MYIRNNFSKVFTHTLVCFSAVQDSLEEYNSLLYSVGRYSIYNTGRTPRFIESTYTSSTRMGDKIESLHDMDPVCAARVTLLNLN